MCPPPLMLPNILVAATMIRGVRPRETLIYCHLGNSQRRIRKRGLRMLSFSTPCRRRKSRHIHVVRECAQRSGFPRIGSKIGLTMVTADKKPMSVDEVTRQWDRVGATDRRRSAIHPAGQLDGPSYFDSGREAAKILLDLARRYLAPSLRDIRVVDFGCGDGRVLKWIAEAADDVWGVDASQAMLEELADAVPSAKRLRSNGTDGRMSTLEADFIYSLAVFIHHDYAGGRAMLRGLSGATIPGGVLVLHIPCYEVPRERSCWDDVTVWTEDQVRSSARSAGLQVLELSVSPGEFVHPIGGPYHNTPVVFRKGG